MYSLANFGLNPCKVFIGQLWQGVSEATLEECLERYGAPKPKAIFMSYRGNIVKHAAEINVVVLQGGT